MTCLRCGRTVPAHTLLCPECLAAPKKPAQVQPEPLQEEAQRQKLERLTRRKRRLQWWLALFIVLSLVAAALLVGSAYYLRRQNSRIAAQTSKINSLQTAMEDLQGALEQSNAVSAALQDTVKADEKIIKAYQSYTGLDPAQILITPPEEP